MFDEDLVDDYTIPVLFSQSLDWIYMVDRYKNKKCKKEGDKCKALEDKCCEGLICKTNYKFDFFCLS